MNTIASSLKLLSTLITKEKKIFKDSGEQVERYSSRDTRQLELLKNPEQSDHKQDGWFIYVPVYFNECLDISKTDRKENKNTIKKWTQGSRFSFHRGCTLYDSPKAYQKWEKAIREIKYCISVENAMDARPAVNFDDRFPGEVEFSVFASSDKKDHLRKIGTFTLSQDEFVRFLIQGNPEIILS